MLTLRPTTPETLKVAVDAARTVDRGDVEIALVGGCCVGIAVRKSTSTIPYIASSIGQDCTFEKPSFGRWDHS